MDHNLQIILNAVERDASRSRPYVIAIDGRCGAGKTTLATTLAEHLHAALFHMDDFFLQPEQRTSERLSTPGENVDHERFLQEVLLPVKEGGTVTYSPYSCATQTLTAPVSVEVGDFVVVEGSYALHQNLRDRYDLTVYLTISPEEQEKRIKCRDGEEIWPMFRDRWIPMEEAYRKSCNVCACADLLLTAGEV